MLGQDLARDSVLRGQREQQVLGVGAALRADPLRLLDRRFQDALRARRDAERRRVARTAAADDSLDRFAHDALAYAELGERRRGEAGLGADREQQVLGPEVAMAETVRLLERPCDHRARRLVEVLRPFERRVDEALVRRLLGHPERASDLRPRAPVGARGLDVAVEQGVAEST